MSVKAVLALGLVLGWLAWAQPAARAEPEGQRWAVLVGVNQYAELGNLNYCVADVRALYERLIDAGFPKENVFLLVDGAADAADLPMRRNIQREIAAVLKVAEKNDLVLISFSGHGMHIDGKSYFCPTDASVDTPETTMIPLDMIYRELEASAASQKVLLVDCRNDPRPAGRRTPEADYKKSLEKLGEQLRHPPEGTVVLSSSAPGQISWEDPDLGHGVFLYYVLEGLRGKAVDEEGQVSLLDLFRYANRQTRSFVIRNRRGYVQTPEFRGAITGDIVLARLPVRVEPIKPPPPLAVAPYSSQQARGHQEAWSKHLGRPREITNSIGMKLVLIPPGEFMMGSPDSEEGRDSDEGPQHRVRITRPFYFGMYQVTQGQYERVMGTNPSAFSRDGRNSDRVSGQDTSRFPVENVSWNDAVEFCRKLSALPAERSAGREYRLPTEAEWEYACRAGTTTRFHFGNDLTSDQARFNQSWSSGHPVSVGSYSANGFGLYDMHGNVWEWCADWFASDYYANSPVDDPKGPASGSRRVSRGGCWGYYAWSCRSAYRLRDSPDFRNFLLGFRLALVPVDESSK
jgi:formylglycine-generating enzyme required for sulfatase activity